MFDTEPDPQDQSQKPMEEECSPVVGYSCICILPHDTGGRTTVPYHDRIYHNAVFWAMDMEFADRHCSRCGGIYLAVLQAAGRKQIVKGIHRMACQVDYKIPLKGLKGEQKNIAESINRIGDGLDAAVEAGMKNERLKRDLITNVSHDIKTPLTSIINYIDLMKRENIQDPKIQSYLEVLEAKAQRLKTLTEDVVEASKVSSGNVVLNCMKLNLTEMIQQTSGEFVEKFEKRDLKEIESAEEPAYVWADGRRTWRILENIYNNAAKYALEGSRIYADLKTNRDRSILTEKCIRAAVKYQCADELTERFIRGDVSRSTEGKRIRLSIARDLAKLMNAKFELYLDGDLFRVTITFARIND